MGSAATKSHEHPPLEAMVQEYQVVYEVQQARTPVGTETRSIGFDVTLSGTHPADPKQMAVPGCAHCLKILDTLRAIAEAVLPHAGEDVISELHSDERSLHQDPGRGFRPEVEVLLSIRHQEDFKGPIDASEERALGEVRAALERLGVREQRWD